MLMNTRGHAAPEVERTYHRAADLARRIENRPELYRTLRGLHRITLIRGHIDRALALARKGVAMARRSGEREDLLEAYVALGLTLFYAGQLTRARTALRRCLRLRRAVHPTSPALQMLDPAIVIRAHLGFLAWLFGEDAEMLEHLAEMRREASAVGELLAIAYSHVGAAMLHHFARDAEAVRADAEALLALSTEHGFSLFVALAHCSRGWALAVGGGQEGGLDEILAGIEQWQAMGAKFLVPYQLGLLCDAQAAFGRPEAALGTAEEALEVVRTTGERWWEPELLRLAGELRGGIARRARGARRMRERRVAIASLRGAAALARQRGARALVQRVRGSLDRLV
jgi:tetratricopeptide (TPR) repeat protein